MYLIVMFFYTSRRIDEAEPLWWRCWWCWWWCCWRWCPCGDCWCALRVCRHAAAACCPQGYRQLCVYLKGSASAQHPAPEQCSTPRRFSLPCTPCCPLSSIRNAGTLQWQWRQWHARVATGNGRVPDTPDACCREHAHVCPDPVPHPPASPPANPLAIHAWHAYTRCTTHRRACWLFVSRAIVSL